MQLAVKPLDDTLANVSTRPMVTPFARALALLSAYTPQDRWLGNTELAQRTGLPASTVTRLAQTLVSLGYLLYEAGERKYRLGAAVLALGYAAFANSEMQRLARSHMQAFATQQKAHVLLSSRYRLNLIVLESCSNPQSTLPRNVHIGARVPMASSPMGWALLASLPEAERFYLINNVERRMPREWLRLRRRANEAIAQVHEKGYCSAISALDPSLNVVAVPVHIVGDDPRVLACAAPTTQLGRARVERELAPRLLAMARLLQQTGEVE